MSDTRFDNIRTVGGERYQAFLDAGYREHYSRSDFGRMTPYLLQKALCDADGRRTFFVNVWCYDWVGTGREDTQFSIQPEVQFNIHGNQSPTFEVTLHARAEHGPAEIEAFFQAIYDRIECGPYDGDD